MMLEYISKKLKKGGWNWKIEVIYVLKSTWNFSLEAKYILSGEKLFEWKFWPRLFIKVSLEEGYYSAPKKSKWLELGNDGKKYLQG